VHAQLDGTSQVRLPESRRGYPGYRRLGVVPRRPRQPQVAQSRGHSIAYDDVRAGPAVVLLHGMTLSGGDWWETGAIDLLLDAGFRAVIVDPLGHGQSDGPAEPTEYRYPDVALDTLAVMDAAGIERAAVWGYSRGEVLATALAIEAPQRVERLVVGGCGGMEVAPPAELTEWQTRMLAGDWQAYWDTPLGETYTPAERRYAEAAFDPRAFAAAMAGRRLHPYELVLAAVQCPVVVYEGGEDSSSEVIEATAAGLGTRARILSGLDHATAVVEAGRVWEVVRPFLDGD
jgi:pimeloyl-ACP methyl ester carboxylesterase